MIFNPLMYKNRQRSTEAGCRLFCCLILLSRYRFCSFLKLPSYRHTANRVPFLLRSILQNLQENAPDEAFDYYRNTFSEAPTRKALRVISGSFCASSNFCFFVDSVFAGEYFNTRFDLLCVICNSGEQNVGRRVQGRLAGVLDNADDQTNTPQAEIAARTHSRTAVTGSTAIPMVVAAAIAITVMVTAAPAMLMVAPSGMDSE